MALGNFSGGYIEGGNYWLRVDWSSSADTANNRSRVIADLYLCIDTNYSINVGARDASFRINGETYAFTASAVNTSGYTSVRVGSVQTGYINHDADGTKSVSITAVYDVKATLNGNYYNTMSTSGTATLDSIPVVQNPSTISVSPGSLDITGSSSISVSINRQSTALTHEVTFSLGTSSYTVTNVGTSTSYTIPSSWIYEITSSTSGSIKVLCHTYNGSTYVGSDSAWVTAYVPSSYTPSAGTISVTRVDKAPPSHGSNFIQNMSQYKVTFSDASGIAGSSISSYSASGGGVSVSGNGATTSSPITSSGSVTITGTVTDSRGRTASTSTVITVTPYTKPPMKVNINGVLKEVQYVDVKVGNALKPYSRKQIDIQGVLK